MPPLAPLPAPAAGSAAAAGVAVVDGLCFGLNGAPTGEPAPPLVDAPSLRDQIAAVNGMAASVQTAWSPKQLQRGRQLGDSCMRQSHPDVRCRTCTVGHGRLAAP